MNSSLLVTKTYRRYGCNNMGQHHIVYCFVTYCHIAICAETGFVGILVLHAKSGIGKKQFK